MHTLRDTHIHRVSHKMKTVTPTQSESHTSKRCTHTQTQRNNERYKHAERDIYIHPAKEKHIWRETYT